uniref:Uncharacterized protein n=1 Tax=Romanomermis culicivorax TaxID=13658 RepID=A0A915JUB7_ROMCU
MGPISDQFQAQQLRVQRETQEQVQVTNVCFTTLAEQMQQLISTTAFSKHMIKCVILDDNSDDQCIIGTDFLAHPDIHGILNFKDNYIEIQNVKLPLKVIAVVCPQSDLFLNAAHNNLLEEIPEVERVSFCEDKWDTFSQMEEIEAEQLTRQAQPSSHELPSGQLEVTELAKPIFLFAQASVSILPNCQQWVTCTIFPSTLVSIPDLIIQSLTTNQVAIEFPIDTPIVNVTNGKCPPLFVNNMPNSIKLRPNQLTAMAKHMLEYAEPSTDY